MDRQSAHQRRGIAAPAALLVALVVALFIGILVPISMRAAKRGSFTLEAEQMRRLYVGLAIYQDLHGGRFPTDLRDIALDVDRADFTSPFDPFAQRTGPYPLEPTLPDWPVPWNVRSSYAYAGHYFSAAEISEQVWHEHLQNPHHGILASIWPAGRTPTTGWNSMGGTEVLRITVDGSISQVNAEPNSPAFGDFDALFVRH